MLLFPENSVYLYKELVNSSTFSAYSGEKITLLRATIKHDGGNSSGDIKCDGNIILKDYGHDDISDFLYLPCNSITFSKSGQGEAFFTLTYIPGYNTTTRIKSEMTNGDILISSFLFIGIGLFLAFLVLNFSKFFKLARS